MKVISGLLKGRIIEGYNIDGTRPTMDRVKESIFAMIGDKVKNSIVLDLFAGSGNYGIEAISLGANKVYFNDNNIEAIKVIKKNINKFQITNKSIILKNDYQKCLDNLKTSNIKFDLVFLDPPYKMNVIDDILEYLVKFNLLKKDSFVVVELTNDNLKEKYDKLVKYKNRKYGDKIVYIYKLEN